MTTTPTVTHRSQWAIFLFWLPLAMTWLMMAAEGPFLAAIIARLDEPAFNLAAHGVAVAMAILVEAPVIMIMSASTALVEDAWSFRKLRNFSNALNVGVTAIMLVVLIPPVFRFLMQTAIGLPNEIAHLTYGALWLLLPWPAAIGYRRFFHGLLIRSGRTRLVAYGTIVRMVTMTTTAFLLYGVVGWVGAYVGAAALSAGVIVEGIVSRFMVHRTIHRLLAQTEPVSAKPPLTYSRIAEFYYPLALTSLIGLAIQPMLTFFMGRAPSPIESLAVYPVVHALSFIFRAMGLSFQEAAIALLGDDLEHFAALNRFAILLGVASSIALGVIAFTPVADVWFQTVSGLDVHLTSFALLPTQIIAVFPFFSVMLSLQRAILVKGHNTAPVTWATIAELVGVASIFTTLILFVDVSGVTAAVISFVVGRIAGMVILVPPCVKIVRDAATLRHE